MGKHKDSLVELIQHLTSSEKRYFKLHASIHRIGDANTYVKLFDFIAKEQNCNDEKIKKAFKGEAFLNRLSVSKTRLYNQLLHVLGLFHSSQGIETSIWRKVQAADVLLKKELTRQALTLLTQAKKLAQRYEKHELALLIMNKELPLINRFSDDKTHMKYRQQLHLETAECMHFIQIKTLHAQFIPFLESWMMNPKQPIPSKAEILIKTVTSIPSLKGAGPKLRLALNDARLMQTIFEGSIENAFAHIYKSLGIIKNLQKTDLTAYRIRLHLIGGIIALELQNKLAFQDHYNSLCLLKNELKNDGEERLAFIQNSLYFLEFKEENRRQHFINNPTLLQNAWEYWKKHKSHIPAFLSCGVGLLLSGVCFEMGLYRKTKTTLTLVEGIPNSEDQQEDVYLYTQIQRIMVGIQMNDETYTQHVISQTKRHVRLSCDTSTDTLVILEGLSRINSSKTYFERTEKFEALYQTLLMEENKVLHSDLYRLLIKWALNQSTGHDKGTTNQLIAL
jgi:hypothetical protein